MAPEAVAALAAGRGHADPRADVYALGLILYELPAGAFPYPDSPPGPATGVYARLHAGRVKRVLQWV